MKIVKSLLLLGAMAGAGAVSAQVFVRPIPAQQVQTAQAAPEWLAKFNQLQSRIVVLENQLNVANQKAAQLRSEYDSHTHGSAVGNLTYNGQGAISGFKQKAFVWTTTRPVQREPSVEFTN
jgi:hypothetical protein